MFTKKIIPLFAIALGLVLAVATSGFRIDGKEIPDAFYTFEYIATLGSFTQDDVQDVTNWKYTSVSDRCDDLNVRACKIYVTQGDVVADQGTYHLEPNFNIEAAPGSVSYVLSTGAGSTAAFITNKSGL